MRLSLLNLENLFLSNSSEMHPLEKSTEKLRWLAEAINDISPDILMLCEVGGLDSLNHFNRNYLNNQFTPFLLPGNSDRGIEIGYLVKKNLPLTFKHTSHREKGFSRDVSELRIYKNNNLILNILLVHLKSKWDRVGNDPKGFLKRSQEVETLIEVYNNLEKEFPLCPIIIAGDLNGVAQKNDCEREFRTIYQKTNLNDLLDIINLPPDDRTTYIHFGKEGTPEYYQLDYIFLPLTLIDKIKKAESGIYRYKDANGLPLRLPLTSFERYALPSDHYPLVLDLDFLQ